MSFQAFKSSVWSLGSYGVTAQSKATIETRSATARARDVDLDLLDRLYTLVDRSVVRSFLMQRPFLVSLLLEAYGEIAAFFATSPLRLNVVTDPEDNQARYLVLSIVTTLAPDVAVARLQALDNAWWLDAMDRARNQLTITITPDEL